LAVTGTQYRIAQELPPTAQFRSGRFGETTLSLLHGTIAAGVTASTIILAMSLGFIVAKMIVDYLGIGTGL